MATSSQVKVGLDAIADIISSQRTVATKIVQSAASASDALAALPTTYADLITTVNAYGTSNAFEANAKAELAKLTTEFTALKGVIDAIKAATF